MTRQKFTFGFHFLFSPGGMSRDLDFPCTCSNNSGKITRFDKRATRARRARIAVFRDNAIVPARCRPGLIQLTYSSPFFSFVGICTGLREVRIQIPTAVKKGDSATLNCWYDTEGDPLYAVKWYKGGREFYRYAPNENPAVKTFPIGNLTVKVSPPPRFPHRY